MDIHHASPMVYWQGVVVTSWAIIFSVLPGMSLPVLAIMVAVMRLPPFQTRIGPGMSLLAVACWVSVMSLCRKAGMKLIWQFTWSGGVDNSQNGHRVVMLVGW